MTDTKAAPDKATTNPFEVAKQSVILKTKVIPTMAFIYRGFPDLENLIKFVGSRPMINGDMTLQFKKTIVPNNSVVLRNQYGEIVKVMTFADAADTYDIAAQSDFRPEDSNKVVIKEVKTRTKSK